MKRKGLLALLVSITLALVLSGCTQIIEKTVKETTEVEKMYPVLNPVGLQQITEMSPLAPRIDTLDGKTIWFSQAEADAVIMPALWGRLQQDYPRTTWKQKITSSAAPIELTEEEMKTADALIQGVAWRSLAAWRQAEYTARLEKAGIPTVLIEFADQHEAAMQTASLNGFPNIRTVTSPGAGTGQERVAAFYDDLIKALTAPLTDKEKATNVYTIPPQPRVMFESTLDEAQEFFQQTTPVENAPAPIAKYTDGLPIIIPTEEKVREMLTGTSHRPAEVITLPADSSTGEKGKTVLFWPTYSPATVEKVAINAVMAGCKPEHLPVVLAQSCSGCPTGTTVFSNQWTCVSGPIAREIGINNGVAMMDPGNPVNAAIGRSYYLMARNLGGALPGKTYVNSHGNPMSLGGTCFAENAEGLPSGWLGLNEESGYKKDESVLMVYTSNAGMGVSGGEFAPSSYRSLQESGTGGMATRLGVQGIPGPHNWLEYYLPALYANKFGARTFVMTPEMARHLYEYGFKSKEAVYEWLWEQSFITVGQFRTYGWYGFRTSGGDNIEPMSGEPYKDLPDDYLVPAMGYKPFENCIIVGGGPEQVCLIMGPRDSTYPIDPWR